ncbi:MAG: hypothetical protein IMZ55_03885 [Acidobacteria bacterium]|nr:hypothetical protein [Acidobacteriota bacterium]
MNVEFLATDCTGDRQAAISVPEDRTVGQVRPQVLEGLRLGDGGREAVTWWLYNTSVPENRLLSDNEVVRDVIRPGHTVRVVPNIVAGG